jgi:hypothetical protein
MIGSWPSFPHLKISSGPSPFFILSPQTEAIMSVMLWLLSVASRHEDEMTGDRRPRGYETEIFSTMRRSPRCSKMRALIEDGHPE